MIRGALILGWFGLLFYLEQRRGLRRSVESKGKRTARNLAIAATAAPVSLLLEMPAALAISAWAEHSRWGIVQQIGGPQWLTAAAAVLLMDYTLYWWHMLTHRVPFLWRFHQVHHIDRDLDASTALRFHFGEIGLSIVFRAAQVFVFGTPREALLLWQTLLFHSILFHHSNVRLPAAVEAMLMKIIVTPRMHGIHHSRVAEELNSNWSSGLSIWDTIHGTRRDNVPQQVIRIGIHGFDNERQVALTPMLTLPFRGPGAPPEPR